jgi:hypothetical protein
MAMSETDLRATRAKSWATRSPNAADPANGPIRTEPGAAKAAEAEPTAALTGPPDPPAGHARSSSID